MFPRITAFIFAILCSFVLAQDTKIVDGKNLDELIGEIFPSPSRDGVDSTTAAPINLQPVSQTPSAGIPGNCSCVPYYLCSNGSVNTNGEGIIDIRLKDGPCESYIDVCCETGNEVQQPITPTPPPTRQSGCGRRNPDGIGFRIKGDADNEAQFGEFPWMVAVLREESIEGNPQKLNIYQCGGALIHPQVVLTAAHCVAGKNKQLKIRAGEWDTQTKKELFPHQDREAKTIIVHPQYYAGALHNDVALLILDSPVDIADNVDVICLPPQGTVVDNTRCFASGWGKDTYGKEGKYQVILKKIDLPIVAREPCQELLRKTRLGKFFELHRSFVCAGGEPGKDTCKGDGGSPLVCPISGQNERYYQAGIVAWGIGCGDNNLPGVYVNVALFRDWIDEQISYNSIDTDSYKY